MIAPLSTSELAARKVTLPVALTIAALVVGYGEHWALTEAPTADLSYTAASTAAQAFVGYLN